MSDMIPAPAADPPTPQAEPAKTDLKLAGGKGADWWAKELPKARKAWKTYRERARKVVERYRDERNDVNSTQEKSKRFNILYSNTETLGPVIYSNSPVPDIRRRWQDRDPVGRVAAQVLQRATQYSIESYDFDGVLDACKQDYLLPGFACARVKYTPYIKRDPVMGEDGQQAKDEKGKPAFTERVVYHEVGCDYVPWDMVAMSRSRKYERVWYIAYGDDLTKDEVEAQFGKDMAEKIAYGRRETDDEETDGAERHQSEQVARVWEVWCKRGRGRFVIAEGCNDWLKAPEADPLKLENFFPSARPLWAISTNDTLVPVPEYLEYQDQALELDDLTARIDVLTSALKRRGVYDQQFQALASMLAGRDDNQFVAIENWAAFMDKGGLEKLAFEMPLDGVVAAVVALEDRRERVKQIIYEVTGISDIVRGASDPNETATAQQMKGKWAGLRISTRQKKFAAFARDLVRLQSEVIAERFDAKTLSMMTGVQLPTAEEKQQWQAAQQAQQQQAQAAAQAAQQAQQMGQQPQPQQPPQPDPEEVKFYSQPTWEEVIQVLRDDKLRGFKIDIETDSTVQPDADAEKQARIELVTGIGQASQQLAAGVQAGVISQDAAKELFAFAIRAFKAGTKLDEALDAMGPSDGMSQQQQQKEQELQKREQAVQQAEVQAKDVTHKAQLASKDAERATDKLKYDQDVFDLTKKFDADVERIREEFAQLAQKVMGHAEETVRGVVQGLDQPTGAVQ